MSVGTFDWHSIRPSTLKRMPLGETAVMVLTVVIVVATHDLAIGVVAGVIVAMIVFARRVARFATVDRRDYQFLYNDGTDFVFMDNDTYDQFVLSAEQLGETAQYLKDGMTLDRTSYQGETIGVELPVTVDLKVVETEPGFAGDTQSGARKPATTESGLIVTVPIFVEPGDTIRIDTRTGEYQTRV